MNEQIRRVAVWSGWLRLVHGVLAISTLVLLATGWLVAKSPMLATAAADIHYLGASVLIATLALRAFLGFFGKGSERFEHMLPQRSEFKAMRASLLFYLSLGKAPLPGWYAHNPLWKPVYLLLFLSLLLLAVSGWLMPETPVIGRFYLPTVHVWLAKAVLVMTLAHLFSVVLQDVKGKAADISAMLSGYRYFSIDREGIDQGEVTPVSVKLGDISRMPQDSERKR
ncbi:MAG: cytochrome b/b6 domain-containing protein [Sedimenticolaceae bacterium]